MNKNIKFILSAFLLSAFQTAAFASGGASTATSGLTSITSWLSTWIPLAATLAVIITALAYMFHMIQLNVMVRLIFGLILIGSASYLVSMFIS